METLKKIYVGCGLTSTSNEFKNQVGELKDSLRTKYEVYDFVGLEGGSAEDVYRWDIEHCVADCDILVGICDHPSIGLGWELATAIHLGKKVLGFAHESSLVTRLVIGAAAVKEFEFLRYNDLVGDVGRMLRERV